MHNTHIRTYSIEYSHNKVEPLIFGGRPGTKGAHNYEINDSLDLYMYSNEDRKYVIQSSLHTFTGNIISHHIFLVLELPPALENIERLC